jgi:hypothetical protein
MMENNHCQENSTRRIVSFLTRLSKNKVIRSEQLTKWASTDRVHGSRFQIHENRTWDVPSASGLIEVNIDSFELEVRISMVSSYVVHGMESREVGENKCGRLNIIRVLCFDSSPRLVAMISTGHVVVPSSSSRVYSLTRWINPMLIGHYLQQQKEGRE